MPLAAAVLAQHRWGCEAGYQQGRWHCTGYGAAQAVLTDLAGSCAIMARARSVHPSAVGWGRQQRKGMGGLSTGWQGAFRLALCQDGGGGGMAVLLAACRQGTGGLRGGGSRAGPGLKQSSGRGVPAGVPGRGQQHLGVHGVSRSHTGASGASAVGEAGGRPGQGPVLQLPRAGQGRLRAVTAAWTSVAAAGATSAPCFHPLLVTAAPSPRWQHRSAPGRPRTPWG